MNPFDDWRYRWSRLSTDGAGRWLVHHFDERSIQHLRPLKWWSPRDWVRIPLHRGWARRWF